MGRLEPGDQVECLVTGLPPCRWGQALIITLQCSFQIHCGTTRICSCEGKLNLVLLVVHLPYLALCLSSLILQVEQSVRRVVTGHDMMGESVLLQVRHIRNYHPTSQQEPPTTTVYTSIPGRPRSQHLPPTPEDRSSGLSQHLLSFPRSPSLPHNPVISHQINNIWRHFGARPELGVGEEEACKLLLYD